MDKNLTDVCSILEDLVCCAKKQVSYGVENMNTDEFNAIMDGVKDMAETKYYLLVAQAMEDKEDDRYYTPHIRGNYRMGYNDIMHQEPYIDGYLHDPNFESRMMDDKPYDRYKMAKRHYTETHDSSDKSKMDAYAKEHLTETMATMKDIWSDASPELRQKMKMDLKSLVDGLA